MLLAVSAHARADDRRAAWPGYPVILWQTPGTAAQLARLPALGITAVRRFPTEPAVPGTRDYVENIATDFYAAYHRWTPTRPVTALFDDAKARHRADPADASVFVRTPSLSDPGALAAIQARLRQTVQASGGRSLYYSLGDETGIADLAAAWDFDLSPVSLAAFRTWLAAQYGTLDALNRQWATGYTAWDDVAPELTTAAMARTDGNYSAWADFKEFMDRSFAGALRAGADAVHAADPAGLAAIEGAQIPGWGGYDYGGLAGAVDVMEIYDAAANIDIALSLDPGLIVLTTSFQSGPDEVRRLWRDRLRGARGVILWDSAGDVVQDDGPGPRGAAMAAAWRDLAGPAAAQFAAGDVRPGGVAVLYSQASFRTEWMLAHAAGGDTWTARDAERENEDTPWRASLRRVQSALAHLALTPRWLSSPMLAAGALRDAGLHALLLPRAIALSDAEVNEIGAFRRRGGLVLAEGPAGLYDAHSRIRPIAPDIAEPVVWPDGEAGLSALAARLPPPPVARIAAAESYVRWTGSTAMVGVMPDTGLDVLGLEGRRLHVSPTILIEGATEP